MPLKDQISAPLTPAEMTALINLDRRLQDFCGRDLSVLHLRNTAAAA